MNTLLIILTLFLLFCLVLLIIPIDILIDSKTGQYGLSWWRILFINIIEKNHRPTMRVQSWLWTKDVDLISVFTKRKKDRQTNKPVKRTKGFSLKKIRSFLRSFEIKECYIKIDTGDYVWNAYLYPFFFFLSRNFHQWNWQINFQGEQRIRLSIRNRPIRIIRALLH